MTNKIPEATSVHDMELENATIDSQYIHLQVMNMTHLIQKHSKLLLQNILMMVGRFLPLDIPKNHNLSRKIQSFTLRCFHGFSHMVWVALGMKGKKKRLSDAEHKRHLLMYHDKCFQKDSHFPLIAFNHEQI